jgi:hypothetical protein
MPICSNLRQPVDGDKESYLLGVINESENLF